MKFPLTIIFFHITSILFAQQNLVPNPSFEDTIACPTGSNQVENAVNWFSFGNTPEYFNACSLNMNVPNTPAGFQNAFDGNAFCGLYTYYSGTGIIPNYREYIGAQLLSPTIVGQKYFVSYKASMPNTMECVTNNLGMLFSTVPYSEFAPVPIDKIPQIKSSQLINDTINWISISGSFVADSSYNYIIIGNFSSDDNTDTIIYNGHSECYAYYFIDMVCVSTDTLACYLPDVINENDSFFPKINIFPNPMTDELIIEYAILTNYYFDLYNLTGVKRKAVILDCGSQIKEIDLTDIDDGLYFYSVVDRNSNRIKTGKLIVIK